MKTTATTSGSSLVELLRQAGLDGRGGAGFSTASKIELALAHGRRAHGAHGAQTELIVNACDGELGASKDGYVPRHRLEEVRRAVSLLSRLGVGRVRYAAHRDSATAALITAAGLDLLAVPHRYVSSEASSLVSLAAGGLARPVSKRSRLVEGGRDSAGRKLPPTLVLNAETLWRVAQIVEFGVVWFRSSGTPDEPGPRLVTITGAVGRPGVVETQAGVPLEELLTVANADPAGPVHVGGLAGGWVPSRLRPTVRWSRSDLTAVGADLGAATVTVLAARQCPLEYASRLLDHAAGESAGQCGPCMFGLPAVAADLRAVTAGDRGGLLRAQRRLPLLGGRGACHFPDGVARFAASTLTTFAGHVEDHLAGHCEYSCAAGETIERPLTEALR